MSSLTLGTKLNRLWKDQYSKYFKGSVYLNEFKDFKDFKKFGDFKEEGLKTIPRHERFQRLPISTTYFVFQRL